MKDIFVKQNTITLFHTILTTFLNLCEIVKMTYNLKRREYFIDVGNKVFQEEPQS